MYGRAIFLGNGHGRQASYGPASLNIDVLLHIAEWQRRIRDTTLLAVIYVRDALAIAKANSIC